MKRGFEMSNVINKQEELVKLIENLFGFKKELIKNPEQVGLWHVKFCVNRIKYYGAISFFGALPTIRNDGYETTYYIHDTPVEEWYYDAYIKDKPVRIIKSIDPENGDWKDTGIICKDQEEAKARINNMDNPEKFWYDIVD